MIKNMIISGLLTKMFADCPGWAAAGTEKFLLCCLLTVLLAILIRIVEVKGDLRKC